MASATTITERLGVCSWSLQPTSPADLIDKLNQIGLARVQLALEPLRGNAAWAQAAEAFEEAGITIVSGMLETVGEDYTTLETIQNTGGVVPDATWTQSWSNMQQAAPIGQALGLSLVTFHAGFLPHDPNDPTYNVLVERITKIANLFNDHGMNVAFETGQEEAATLADFLDRLAHPAVGVNFDPANMVLYDKGDPIVALRHLAPYLQQVHIKDATRTQVPGTWGQEVVVGTGDVDWTAFFDELNALDYHGDLMIEREAGEQRVADIRTARQFVEQLCGQ